MKSTAKWSTRDLILGAALCVALVSLAILQYRWIGQVGEVERIRLDRNLRTSLTRLTDDFDSELERLAQVLAPNAGRSDAPRSDSPAGNTNASPIQEAETRLAVWRTTSLHPQLVSQIWDSRNPSLSPQLSKLADRTLIIPEFVRGGGGRGGPGRLAMLVDFDAPALAVPSIRSGGVIDHWTLVELNLAYIRDTLLPELIMRDFGSEYEVVVMRGPERNSGLRDAKSVLFDSERITRPKGWDQATLDAAIANAVRGDLFQLRFGQQGRGRRGFGPPAGNPPPNGDGPPPDGKDDRKGKGGWDRDHDRDGGPEFGRGGPFNQDAGAPWLVLASYKSGPLDEVVASARRRNLAVSFGILVLTGFSVAMLMFSSRRASALARQQMEFVAGVTHELRTPLAVISSASQNLADGVTSGPEQTRRYGSVIHTQSQRLADTVEQVLRFAGLSNDGGKNRSDLYAQRVDVTMLLENAIADCQDQLDAANMIAVCNVEQPESGEDLAIRGDAGALGHCLRNLLSNAAKHGARVDAMSTAATSVFDPQDAASFGPWVQLRAVAVNAPANGKPVDAANSWVEILVEDNGPGIPADDLAHIFEPFYRGRRATDDQIQGTGLGLSLAKKIVEAHGGTIQVTSRVEVGTTFTLRLPRKSADQESREIN